MFRAVLTDQISASQVNAGKARFFVSKNSIIGYEVICRKANSPLVFVAYEGFFIIILFESGFRIDRVTFGRWRGFPAAMVQDEIVARPVVALPKDFDLERYLELNAGMAKSGMDTARNILTDNRLEGRPWR